ncbi:thiamine phosphate synthase [Desulfomicrobium baculatum]|uniref:Thiamine-phosphate synthase n=1 Tax=Desulfomicrobium baculatum (strain DSM 4028 / VKM B-1378 / X) TaxID=525897 RepID=C7LNK7_DESBD|nr:thiamine phosphate synthase [Desulfomicrobium baculatum]ACU88892.1 thiamine-phosphate pyrophosphorylase [Desulfomicrobium baculatum DSM 4028]
MNGRELVTSLMRIGGLYGLTAEKFSLGRRNADVVQAMLDGGIRIIQYREKTKKMGLKYEECLHLRAMTREAGAAFIVNDDIDLALLVGADGVHVGQEDLPLEAVRSLVGENMAIGLSTHSPEQGLAAEARGADYIGVGPIFATQTKEDVCAPVGFAYLDFVAGNLNLPFVAIGGIKEHNLAEVAAHGARCMALVTEITAAADIRGKIAALTRILHG